MEMNRYVLIDREWKYLLIYIWMYLKWFRLIKDMYHIICLQRSILVDEFNNGTRRNTEYILT